MISKKQEKNYKPTKYSFGSTSAIITNLTLITGLITSTNAKISIIGGLLVSAFADNISDALGIHIYQESEGLRPHQVWVLTLSNFISGFKIFYNFCEKSQSL